MEKKTLMRSAALFFALMICFTILSRAAYQEGTAVVQVGRPDSRTINHMVSAAGKIEVNQELAITTLPDQMVTAVYVQEGQQVEEGEVLFEIDVDLLEEEILYRQQELEKQKLQMGDIESAKETSNLRRANEQAQASESYSLSVNRANVALARASRELQDAKRELEQFYQSAGIDMDGNEVEKQLTQEVEEKQTAYIQAEQELSSLQWKIEMAVYEALQKEKGAQAAFAQTKDGAVPERQWPEAALSGEGGTKTRSSDFFEEGGDLIEEEAGAGSMQGSMDHLLAGTMQKAAPEWEDAPQERYFPVQEGLPAAGGEAQDEMSAWERYDEWDDLILEEDIPWDPSAPDMQASEILQDGSWWDPRAEDGLPEDLLQDTWEEEDLKDSILQNAREEEDSRGSVLQGTREEEKPKGSILRDSPEGKLLQDETAGSSGARIAETGSPIFAYDQAMEQKIRSGYESELERAKQKAAAAKSELEKAKAVLDQYQQERLAAANTQDSRTERQLLAEIQAAQDAYTDAAVTANEAAVTGRRAIQTAGLAEASDSTGRIYQIAYEQKQLELEKLEKLKEKNGKITAPADGIVTKIDIMTGGKTMDTRAVLLADLKRGYHFRTEITKDQEKYLGTGDLVTLTIGNGKKQLENLPVTSVRADETDENIYHVTVSLTDDGTISAGMSALLEVTKKSRTYAVCVPLTALHLDEKNQAYVLTPEEVQTIMGSENRARKVSVTVLEQNERYAALAEGSLSGQQEIIVSSDRSVDDGSRVRIAAS